jgi:hypothetical protein
MHQTTRHLSLLVAASIACVAALWFFLAAEEQPRLPADESDAPSGPSSPLAGESAVITKEPAIEVGVLRETAECLVRVVDPATNAVAGAHVIVWGAQQSILLSATTDKDGLARISGVDGDGVLVAVAPWGAITDARVPQLTGSHVLAVGGASVVQGVALVDGAQAPVGLELSLQFRLGPGLAGAAEPLVERVTELAVATTSTDAEGRFCFTGLPADWRGALLPPRTHWITAGQGDPWVPQRLDLPAADPGVTLRLTRLPTVSGVVVWDDDGAPVDAAVVLVQGAFSGGINASAVALSDEQGRFEIGLTPTTMMPDVWQDPGKRGKLERLSLGTRRVVGASGDVQVDPVVGDGVVDPVELRVSRAPRVYFAAIGLKAEPIPFARVDGDAVIPADRAGRGSFSGPAPSLVGAPGRAVVPAVAQRGTGESHDPMVFVLPPRNTLWIRVESSMPLLGRKLWVVLESDSLLMAGGRRWRPFDAEMGGTEWRAGGYRVRAADGDKQVQTLEAALGAAGVVEIHSLEPRMACVAKVKDSLGFVIAEDHIRAPAYGKNAITTLRVEAAPRRLAGIVWTADGSALVNARVWLHIAGMEKIVHTRGDGAFEFVIHSVAPADIEVSAPGFLSEWRRGIVSNDSDVSIDFRLTKGRSLLIQVRDPGGAAVPLLASPLGFEHLESQCVGEGDYLWRDLPSLVEFYADLQGNRYRVRCDASVSTATLSVPAIARVLVPVSALPAEVGRDPRECRVLLRCLEGEAKSDVLLDFSTDDSAWQVVLPGRYEAQVVARSQPADSGTGAEFVPVGIRKVLVLTAGGDERLDFQ